MRSHVSLLTLGLAGLCCAGSEAVAAVQVNRTFSMPVRVDLSMQASECSNAPGPQIAMQGDEMALAGLGVDMIFRNYIKGTHTYTDATVVNETLVPADQTMTLPKQPVLGGVGGNPWISVLFRQGDGDAIGSETLLGRCVQLSQ